MSPLVLRRILLTALVLICLMWVLAGCATEHYHWTKGPEVCHAAPVWHQVNCSQMRGLCGSSRDAGLCGPDVPDACVIGCLVISAFSEPQAQWIETRDGESLYDHEMRHVHGEKHQ